MSEIIQVSLRGSRREFVLNSRHLWLRLRDKVVVQGEYGETLATILLKDPTLIALKKPGNVTREIIRKAEEEDLDQDDHNRALEDEAFEWCRQRIELRELKMDLSEVEVAFRRNRITFFFTAEQRVDFRELVKDLASRFQTRIELRQIGVRDQAKRVDGCGPCGRAFCCSTWMKGFHPVTLKMARAEPVAEPRQDLGRVRPADVLPVLRAGAVPRQRRAHAGGGHEDPHRQGPGRGHAHRHLQRSTVGARRRGSRAQAGVRRPAPRAVPQVRRLRLREEEAGE
jgi:cell fate regulator YaaT (PSP1 superfamily)